VGATTPAFSSQLLSLQFHEGLPLPPSSAIRVPRPLCYVSFCCCLFSLFFPLFSLDGGQSIHGVMLIWPRVVCGSTTCQLAHLVVCSSRAGRSWHLVVQEPSWFLHLMWSGDAIRGLGVWRSWGFDSSLVFPVRCISSVCLGFYFRKHSFCFLPLVAILEYPVFVVLKKEVMKSCGQKSL
jgi:hypothetical protein